jgi:pimeloyl-ACP methyl ester carboxylesterase
MARIVLVHGAFAGAWCWERLAPLLEAAGHVVETLDLPGSGEDQTPVEHVTLDAYADRVCAKLGERDEPAVLVPHSMGGMAATQAAARCPERVAHMVYVAAFLPQDGESLLSLTQLPEGEGDQIQANLVVDGDPPVATLAPAASLDAIYLSCDDSVSTWAISQQRPQPVVPFTEPASLPKGAFDDIPRSYVICTRDRSIPPALQRRMLGAARITDVTEIATDHAPYLSAPEELATALNERAALV